MNESVPKKISYRKVKVLSAMSADCGCPNSATVHTFKSRSRPPSLVHIVSFHITCNYTHWSNNNYEDIGCLPTNLKDCVLQTVMNSNVFVMKKQRSGFLKFCTALLHHRSKCFDFHRLALMSADGISVEVAKQFLNNKPHIKKLILHHCTFVTDELLLHIVKNCPNLQILDLSFCIYMTDVGISALSNLKYLSVLSLVHTRTTDVGLLPVLSSPTGGNFRELKLECCKVAQSLMKIPEYCPLLEILTCDELPEGLDCDFSQMSGLKQLTWRYSYCNIR